MRVRPFGPTGVFVPALGLGTWNLERDDRAGAVAALRRGIELGAAHIDTAEMYGSGRAEELVGEAIRGLRDGVFLASKVLPSNASYAGTLEACERSLRRLGTDRLDLYLLHWPGGHPLAETFRAFERLRAEGKIRHWGVSNFDVEGMARAEAEAGKGRIACDQVLYNLGERTVEEALLPWCEARGIALVAYTPLGGERGFPESAALDAVAARRGATPRQVALAFLLRRPSVFAVAKAGRVPHVEENAVDVELSAADLKEIEGAFPRGPWRGLATL